MSQTKKYLPMNSNRNINSRFNTVSNNPSYKQNSENLQTNS